MHGEAYILWLRQQAQRRAQIKKEYNNGKGKTLAEIARIFGITRARVHQIVNSQ